MSSFQWSPLGSGGGTSVTTINGLSGPVTLAAGTGINISDNGIDTITITNTQDALTLAAFGSSPNDNAASLSGQVLTLQPADATHPGGVSTTTQTFTGVKTFNNAIYAAGGIDVASTGGTDTLTIGITNADVINIGRSGATINLQGDTFYQNVTNLQVTDKLFDVNYGGSAGSGSDAGFNIIENNIAEGYVKTSADRNSWSFKAPNTAGIVTLTPGASGFTIDQASHNPLTLAAIGSTPNANGATLTGQVLNLEPASDTFGGVVTTGAQTLAGVKTFSSAPIMSALTASQAVVTNGSKALASLAYTDANTGSTLVSRTSAGYFSGGVITATNHLSMASSVTTAAGTTTLGVNSNQFQRFIGSTTQTVVLPVATTLTTGWSVRIQNESTGAVTVNTSGGNTVQAMAPSTELYVSCINTSGGTGTASWTWAYRSILTTSINLATLKDATGTTQGDFSFIDSLSRPNLRYYATNGSNYGIMKLGASNADTDSFSQQSNGLVTFGPNLSSVMDSSNVGYARVLYNRFGLFSLDSGTGGNGYYFRVDPTEMFLATDLGVKNFTVTRATGNTSIVGTINNAALTASQAVVTDGSKNLTSLAYASANTASAIVQRDSSGNFSAGTITAALTGTASGNTTISGQTNHGVVTASTTNAMTSTGAGTANQVLMSNGASADPTFQSVLKTNAAKITYSAGTPSVSIELGGDWISSLTDTGTGQIGVNLTSSYYSTAPIVVGNSLENAVSGSVVTVVSSSTSVVAIRVRALNGTLTDEDCWIQSMGEK